MVVVSDTPGYLPPYQQLTQLDKRFDYVLRATGVPGPAASRNMGLAIADAELIVE